MKKLEMKRGLIILWVSLSAFIISPNLFLAKAQEEEVLSSPSAAIETYELPYPGILPDHPLYLFKVLRDRLLLIFNKEPLEKTKIMILLSDKRLAMGEELIKKGKYELGASTISKGEKYLLRASDETQQLINNEPEFDMSTLDRLIVTAKKHQQIISNIFDRSDIANREQLGLSLQLTEEIHSRLVSLKEMQENRGKSDENAN